MNTSRLKWKMGIAVLSVLCLIYSCGNPLTDNLMNLSRTTLSYTFPTDPEPIGDNDSPLVVPLYAGRSIDVGTVEVWIGVEALYVHFNTTWKLTETHLAIVEDPADFPQTSKGNPIPGHFAYKMTHDPDTSSYTYQIPIADFEEADLLFFAAHAEVEEWADGILLASEGAWAFGFDFPGKNWATYFAGAISPEPEYEDGMVSIELIGYPEGNGHQALIGLFVHNSDPYDMSNFVAMAGIDSITDGGGSDVFVATGYPGGTVLPPWIGTGGETYDLYFWVDLNDNFNSAMYPEPGIDATAIEFPSTVFIDGDVAITITGDEIHMAQ